MRRKAKTIQIVGTGSGVGKSVIVAGLCRIFLQEGYKVAPFKAQNMSLNSAVTPDGLEIGRAQAMQAAACGLEPSVNMNPILLKPTSDVGSQVIVYGKPVGNMTAVQYYKHKSKIFGKVKQSLNRLMQGNDIVVIEGAGSPAEVNLKKHDIVNMKIARLIKSPVLLVGDIDRGGVFAWLLGTFDLLPVVERKLVKGFIINKFRGDKALLENGLRFLARRSGKKVVGVLPYYNDIQLPEEDSLFFDRVKSRRRFFEADLIVKSKGGVKKKILFKKPSINKIGAGVKIVVVKLPHISNFTDFDILNRERGIVLEYSTDLKTIEKADCIILPGSKNTCADLQFLYDRGIAGLIKKKAGKGNLVVGICGGYQMLGRSIRDFSGVESKNSIEGLGLLDMNTVFDKKKSTFRVEAKDMNNNCLIKGYEIHHGRSKVNSPPLFLITKRGNRKVRIKDGAVNHKGNVWGTYIHGIFDNSYFRRNFLNKLREKKGLRVIKDTDEFSREKEYDKLADLLRDNLNMKLLKEIINGRK